MRRFRFSLYRRGRIWYAAFYNPSTRRYSGGRSTGESVRSAALAVAERWEREGVPTAGRRDPRPAAGLLALDTALAFIRGEATLADAERIVRALRERGLVDASVAQAGPGAELFPAFLERFWTFDESPYVRAKLAHGHRIGHRRCYDCLLHVKHHWQPTFKGRKLSEIRKADLQAFSLSLAEKGLAGKTVNHILSAGTVALRWAAAEDLIPADPGQGLMKFSGKPARRGVLTEKEAAALFKVSWADERARVGNLVAMATGLRAGEVLGLQVQDIGADRLHVRHSWSAMDGLKGPKSNETREVPLIATVRAELLQLALKNPHGAGPSSFVFWSLGMVDRPMDFHFLLDGLKAALLRVSLTEEELEKPKKVSEARDYWRSRKVCFHSWRHLFAARMADRLEQRKVMSATGHASAEVFRVYADHCDAEVFQEVREAAAEAFGKLIPFGARA